jgi:hypothetical protein
MSLSWPKASLVNGTSVRSPDSHSSRQHLIWRNVIILAKHGTWVVKFIQHNTLGSQQDWGLIHQIHSERVDPFSFSDGRIPELRHQWLCVECFSYAPVIVPTMLTCKLTRDRNIYHAIKFFISKKCPFFKVGFNMFDGILQCISRVMPNVFQKENVIFRLNDLPC